MKPNRPGGAGTYYECVNPTAHAEYHQLGFDCPCHPMITRGHGDGYDDFQRDDSDQRDYAEERYNRDPRNFI